MGKILIIKGADFSANAIEQEIIQTLIRAGYSQSGGSNIGKSGVGWKAETQAVSQRTIITGVGIPIYDANTLSSVLRTNSVFRIASYDRTAVPTQYTEVDLSSIINRLISEGAEAGKVFVALPTPLTLNAGEYCAYSVGDDSDLYTRYMWFVGGVDGSKGYIWDCNTNRANEHGLAIDWYGEEA